MSVFLTIVGGVVVITLCILCVVFFLGVLMGRLNSHLVDLMAATRDLERKRLGEQMASEAYWFSESPEAAAVLRLYGAGISMGADVSVTREAWRKETAGQKTVEV